MPPTPQLTHVDAFTVAGISARTSNRDEMNPATAKLGGLWSRFYAERVADTIPDHVARSPIYGVYSAYESDANGVYTTLAGVRASMPPPGDSPFEHVHIEAGEYLVFERHGEMPLVVFETWQDVWSYFTPTAPHRRTYATDFEEYIDGGVKIWVGVVGS